MIFERATITLLEKAGEVIHRVTSSASHPNLGINALSLGISPQIYHPNLKEHLFLPNLERLKHLYICGGSGMGKSNFIYNLIKQDILQGNGFGLIDAHGDLINQILNLLVNMIERKEMTQSDLNRLVLVDPSSQEYSIGFNPLEVDDTTSPYGQVSEMISIFKKIWKDVSWGARMDELLRATLYTLAENGLTLLEARPLLTDQDYRQQLTENLKNQEIKDYWHNRFESLSDKMQAVYREPVLNKVSIFLSDPDIRLMLGQKKSSVNFRKAMNEGKWVLINLSKGKLKENTFLLGGLFIIKLYQAALSRTNLSAESRKPFYLYIDEFQNFSGEGFVDILSESRKYGLALTLANQNLAQLDRNLLSSIFANASTQVYFRLSPSDAKFVSSEFGHQEGELFQRLLINLKVGEAVLRKKGETTRLLQTFYEPQKQTTTKQLQKIAEVSLKNYGVPRGQLESEMANRNKKSLPQVISAGTIKTSHPVQILIQSQTTTPSKLPENIVEGE